MGQRNYRREYDLYYGKKGLGQHRTAAQALHRKHKTARNTARKRMIRKVGKGVVNGRDLDHKNRNPLDNSPSNLRLVNVHKNRGRNGHHKGEKAARRNVIIR